MTAGEYIRELNKQKQLAIDRFGKLTTIEEGLVDVAFDWLLGNLDVKGGVFDITAELPAKMNEFLNTLTKFTTNSKPYKNAFSNYLHDITVIQKNIDQFQTSFNKVDLKEAGLKPVQQAVTKEIIDRYSENGLNRHFAAPLRDIIYNNVIGGMNQKQARQHLQEYILSDKDKSGKLSQYLNQTAQQGVDSYTGAINMKLAAEIDYTGYIISGSLIDSSSKQCVYAIETSEQGYMSYSDWEKVLEIARNNPKARLIENTTVQNLPLNKLHWGCRHEFTPVIMD